MKTLLYTPCSSRWILSDIIYIYTLEPTTLAAEQTSQLIQKTAANVAGKTLLKAAFKRVVASNVLLLVGALLISVGLRYAIKKNQERKKAAALPEKENNTQQPTIVIPALSRSHVEMPKPTIICN